MDNLLPNVIPEVVPVLIRVLVAKVNGNQHAEFTEWCIYNVFEYLMRKCLDTKKLQILGSLGGRVG
jgi:hypothetical protein